MLNLTPVPVKQQEQGDIIKKRLALLAFLYLVNQTPEFLDRDFLLCDQRRDGTQVRIIETLSYQCIQTHPAVLFTTDCRIVLERTAERLVFQVTVRLERTDLG